MEISKNGSDTLEYTHFWSLIAILYNYQAIELLRIYCRSKIIDFILSVGYHGNGRRCLMF